MGLSNDENERSEVRLHLSGIHANTVKNTSAYLFSRTSLSLMHIINASAPLEHRWRGQLFGQGTVIRQDPDVCFYWVVDAGPNRLVLLPLSANKGLMAPCGQRGKILTCRENAGLTSISIKDGGDLVWGWVRVEAGWCLARLLGTICIPLRAHLCLPCAPRPPGRGGAPRPPGRGSATTPSTTSCQQL